MRCAYNLTTIVRRHVAAYTEVLLMIKSVFVGSLWVCRTLDIRQTTYGRILFRRFAATRSGVLRRKIHVGTTNTFQGCICVCLEIRHKKRSTAVGNETSGTPLSMVFGP